VNGEVVRGTDAVGRHADGEGRAKPCCDRASVAANQERSHEKHERYRPAAKRVIEGLKQRGTPNGSPGHCREFLLTKLYRPIVGRELGGTLPVVNDERR
jgi:hypothetical protein